MRGPITFLVAILITVTSCSGVATGPAAGSPTAGTPTTPAALAVYRGQDRQTLLESGAKREGQLVWYTSLAGDVITVLADAFKVKYPYITKVDIFRGAENEIITRATNEAQAGQPSFDVVESPPTTTALLGDNKLLTPYFSPSVAKIPEKYKFGARDGLVDTATLRFSFIGFAYNTTLFPAGVEPKTVADLMNPAFAGKISLAGSTTGKRWLGSVLHTLGDEKGKAFLTQFNTQQKPVVQQVSGKALLDLIVKGEVPASPTIFRDHVEQAVAERKAPVKWVPLDTAVGNVGQVGLAARSAHPNAALLFLDFLLSDEGERIMSKNGYSTPADTISFPFWVPEENKHADQIEKDAQNWDKLFTSTFRR
jgi:iron(III) transport system substrate-binding protein